ncbi:MaoC/PaaZ C-terminal domain-containing protein [Desulfoglaeba alkanexedens]|uniref:Dehydratase n=1 Tax=Desulfoglaeba alkanexedens ALDC TaxID=980445 RepID=A0A4P8L4J7_9BACT|nr:MaoC/PaaZ C-terminal domain-containing protein [Desulfoglaeba alkanexedens]QCQ22916.1 dehydratase [Desulfoglaeba alkanexedens ALDC]
MSIVLGKYFEEFREGQDFHTLGRTVTEADIVNFSCFSGDFNPLHTDAEFAAKQPFGGRIAHGMCGLSIASGLFVRLNLLEGSIVAFMGIKDWHFKAPIMLGDTIHVHARVAKKIQTSKPDRGIVEFYLAVLNQKDIVVMDGNFEIMMLKKQK